MPEIDGGTAEKVTLLADPVTALPPASGVLFERNQPVSFCGAGVGKQVGVGGTGTIDEMDTAQKIDPAALSAKLPSGPMRR